MHPNNHFYCGNRGIDWVTNAKEWDTRSSFSVDKPNFDENILCPNNCGTGRCSYVRGRCENKCKWLSTGKDCAQKIPSEFSFHNELKKDQYTWSATSHNYHMRLRTIRNTMEQGQSTFKVVPALDGDTTHYSLQSIENNNLYVYDNGALRLRDFSNDCNE
jgi:hypothetical protein